MAYNPFNIFRRNQKAIFAVITVFIMFTFVLSSGLGGGADFFDWLPQWLGQKTRKGDHVCTIDGSKVYASELDKLRFERVMANRFMAMAALYTAQEVDSFIAGERARLTPETRTIIDEGLQAEQFLSDPRVAGSPVIAEMYRPKLEAYRNLATSPRASATDKEVARTIRYLRLLQMQISMGQREHYFISSPNRTNRDLVEYMLWRKKADELGIKLTTADVKKLIEKEFHGFFQAAAEVQVRKDLQQHMANFNINRCVEAIGEEFRVRMAQVALLGPIAHGGRADKTFGGFPMFNTSYEAFEYYREQCSPTTYAAIPVPVANFVPLVGEPNEADPKDRTELRELYEKHRNDEPQVGREAPGLKEPRKVRVEWFSVTGTEPYYVKFAEEQLQKAELHAKVGSLLTVPLLGSSPALLAPAVAPAAVENPLLLAEYQRVVGEHRREVEIRYMRSALDLADPLGFSNTPLDTSVVRPGNLAAGAGALAGQVLAHGDPRVAAAVTLTGPLAYEIRDRVKAGAPAILSALGTIPGVKTTVLGLSIPKAVPGPLPGPGMFPNIIGGVVAHEMMLPKPLPLEALKPTLLKDLVATTAKEIAFGPSRNPRDPMGAPDMTKKGDLQTFIDDVNKLSENGKVRPSEKEKFAAVQKAIAEFAAKRGLTIHGNKSPQSEWNLDEAPELAKLVEAQKKSLESSPHRQQAVFVPFASRFFWEQGDRRRPVSGVYKVGYYPEDRPQARSPFETEAKPQFVAWRSEEVQAKSYASLDEAMPAVKALWKKLKAREEAQRRADALAESVRGSTAAAEATLSLALVDHVNSLQREFGPSPKVPVEPFLIEGVCPLTAVDNPTARRGVTPPPMPPATGQQLHVFVLPPSDHVKYPSQEMRQKLLDERTKPVKTVMVLTDEPKDTYYVVTLIKREVKGDAEFESVVNSPVSPNRNIVLGNFTDHSRNRTVESVIGLLKKEFKYEETEEQKKKLDERRGGD
jgi:hypothetical protein